MSNTFFSTDVFKQLYIATGDPKVSTRVMTIPAGDPVSVLDAMEDRGLFSERNIGEKSNVDGFAWAIDDAVQVLEFVHGNSNIAFLPDYDPL